MKFIKNTQMLPVIASTSTEDGAASNDSTYVKPVRKQVC